MKTRKLLGISILLLIPPILCGFVGYKSGENLNGLYFGLFVDLIAILLMAGIHLIND